MTYTLAKKLNEKPQAQRVFGILGNQRIVIDPEWAKGQEDLEAWLAGDV